MKTLEQLRAEIDTVNKDLLVHLNKRFDILEEIYRHKSNNSLVLHDPIREKEMLQSLSRLLNNQASSPHIMKCFSIILSESLEYLNDMEESSR